MNNLNHLPDIVTKFVHLADNITVKVTPSQRLLNFSIESKLFSWKQCPEVNQCSW